MRGRAKDHQRPTGGSLASLPCQAWLGSTDRPVPARSEPPEGLAGLLAQLLVWPRTPETAARGRRKRRGCAAGLRAAASGRCSTRTPLMLPDTAGRRQRPAPPCSNLQQPQWPNRSHCWCCGSGHLGSRLAAASPQPDRLWGAASGLPHISTRVDARLVQHVVSHGRVRESQEVVRCMHMRAHTGPHTPQRTSLERPLRALETPAAAAAAVAARPILLVVELRPPLTMAAIIE